MAGSRGYLADLDADSYGEPLAGEIGDTLHFQWFPRELSHTVEDIVSGQSVVGRSHRVLQQGAGGKREWPLELAFFRDDPDEAWVARRVLWLESLTVPEFDASGNQVRGPHTCLWVVGKFIHLRVKVTGFGVTFGKLWIPGSQYPAKAIVQLKLEEVVSRSIDYRDVRAGLRGPSYDWS